ncbi:MAG: hypothetical protein MPJ24_00970 [Pirellulaceae bacterium]|nr:hypothetical protein [Pirellulaceae bacterium]
MNKPPTNREYDIFTAVTVHGKSLTEVGQQYNVRPTQVSRIVSKTKKWLSMELLFKEEESLPNLTLLLHKKRLEHQWYEYMNSWYLSSKEAQGGDWRLLEQARKVLAEIRQIIQQITQNNKEGEPDATQIPEEQRDEIIRYLMDQIRNRRTTQGSSKTLPQTDQ